MATNDLTTVPLLTKRSRWRILATVVAGLTLAGGLSTAGSTASAQNVTELPPVTISSTTLRAGETISISGSGCVDAGSGSGAGLQVVLFVPVDGGRGGTRMRPIVSAPAKADGTFAGSGVMDQPFFPGGAQTGFFICQKSSEDVYSPAVAQREVQLTIEAPSLPDLTAAAGSTISYQLPCSILGGEYGRFTIHASADGRDSFYLNASGSYPYETSPKKGEQVELQVPPEATPGVYHASASCSVTESDTSAAFTGFTVTVTPRGPAASTPATPVAGAPSYTG